MLLMEREVRAGTRFKMEEHGPVNDVQSNEQSDKDNLDNMLGIRWFQCGYKPVLIGVGTR